jgi:hypothetical protein
LLVSAISRVAWRRETREIRMSYPERDRPVGCGGECSRCGPGGDEEDPRGLRGRWLVLHAGGAFLVPLGTALIGAAVVGEGGTGQIIGALGGLAIGVGTVLAVGRLIARGGEECA